MEVDFPYKLYLVTDEKACLGRDFFWVVEEALKGGVDIVQLREKKLSLDQFIKKAEKLKEICDRYKVPLIINDNIEVAKHVGSYGIHIGQSDMPMDEAREVLGDSYPVGLSVETFGDLKKPNIAKAWYLGVSPVFSTPTKEDTISEWGLKGLAQLKSMTEKKLVAIGNVKTQNATEIIKFGADCLAVISGICSAPSPAKSAEKFRLEIENGLRFR
ncbi:thiamine phosphate synthase [Belliella sp. R4-6]|uniref:Thiamine-phosphate synthase n=1 Tax=Belliella alkalica TaxID=1730871 RepID=A0ABS9VBY3_9BACT|nr:thiamine phosphate synthase [Belliella alkalica]MCH7413945.1 thiamine phosphate synthase [Belliella alkalica]